MSFEILGTRIDQVSLDQTLLEIERFIKSGRAHQVSTLNPEFIMEAQKNQSYKNILNKSDLNVPDGIGLVLAARFLGDYVKEKITGVLLVEKLARLNHSIFFLGGEGTTAKRTADALAKVNPNLKTAGWESGGKISLDGEAEKSTLEKIKRAKPDILLVAFGSPKQEFFIHRYLKELNVPVSIGVGGTFDFISGRIPRAPLFMQKVGLEWLFRVFIQPWRLNRIITAVIRFPLTIFFWRLLGRK